MGRLWWQERRWLVFWCYVGAVLCTVPFARDVVLTLRNSSLLDAMVTGAYAAATAAVAYHVFFDLRHADWVAFLSVAGFIVIVALLLLGLSVPEERVHFLQYGLMALLARRALEGTSPERGRAAYGIVGAAVLSSALGLLDEILQGSLPSRVFDWRDVGMNATGTSLALVLDELLHDRLRLRGRKTRGQAP